MAISTFISDRPDGLGERLRALANAIYLAKRYSGRMFYEWKNREGWQKEYNSIEEESYVFSHEFICSHSFSKNFREVSILKEVDLAEFAKQSYGASLPDSIKIRVHQTPLYRYIPELKEHYKRGGFKLAFENIQFSNKISECIDYAKSACLPANAIAIHLRAGDIIYGRYNTSARFCGKGTPWEIADSIIGRIKSEGGNVVLFGQDTSLLHYLAAKHNAYLASSFLDSESKTSLEIAIQEIFLMSRCSRILAGSSGFALLASSLAGEIHQRIPQNEIPSAATILKCQSHELDQSISVEQRVFSLRWLIGMHGHALSSDELLEAAQHGLSLLPNDLFFILTKASALSALGSASEASKLIDWVLSSYSVSALTRMFSPSAFGKPESQAHLLSPLMPQIPPSAFKC